MKLILRSFDQNNIESVSVLGEKYKVVRKDDTKIEFDTIFKDHFGKNKNQSSSDYENTFGLITFNSGTESIALQYTEKLYIMSDSGATFTCLTTKKL